LEDLLQTVLVDEAASSDSDTDSLNADSHSMSNVPTAGTTPPASDAAVRLKLLKAELPDDQLPKDVLATDLTCAINVKEKIEVNGWFYL
jgi:hypothetical protein